MAIRQRPARQILQQTPARAAWRIGHWLAGLLLVVGAAGPLRADQTDDRLDGLFAQLRVADRVRQQALIEAEIWAIWTDSGRDDINRLMSEGIDAMNRREYDLALVFFDRIVEQAPEFAEGWNKRATLYYLRDELYESMRDVQRTLELEPRHFGALSGMGLILIEHGDLAGAIQAYREVLKVHPHSINAQLQLQRLQAEQRDRVI